MQQVPIFAVHAVLFPRGLLALRVFEPRYLEMVKDSLRHDTPFGVCLIADNAPDSAAPGIHPVGCLARIKEWDMPELGILQIVAEGQTRFRTDERRVSSQGLIIAGIEAMEPELPLRIPDDFDDLVRLLRALIDNTDERFFPRPWRFDDAVWVSFRLAEALPIPIGRKQQALALEDPLERLTLLREFVLEQRGR